MKITTILPLLFLFASAGFGIPTLISNFTGGPSNSLFEILSPVFLVMAFISFSYYPKPDDGSGPSKP